MDLLSRNWIRGSLSTSNVNIHFNTVSVSNWINIVQFSSGKLMLKVYLLLFKFCKEFKNKPKPSAPGRALKESPLVTLLGSSWIYLLETFQFLIAWRDLFLRILIATFTIFSTTRLMCLDGFSGLSERHVRIQLCKMNWWNLVFVMSGTLPALNEWASRSDICCRALS